MPGNTMYSAMDIRYTVQIFYTLRKLPYGGRWGSYLLICNTCIHLFWSGTGFLGTDFGV